MTDSDESSSLLVAIIDTNPVWWGQRSLQNDGLSITEALDTVLVFLNSHLMLSHRNQLAVIAAHTDSCKYLFPKQKEPEASAQDAPQNGDSVHRGGINGQYELFTETINTVKDQLKDLILKDPSQLAVSESLIAGALCSALCYIHRKEKECSYGETLSSRILVIKGAEDNPSQYMNFMNVVFTAQKQNVVIDACLLDHDSGLLQQACDITGGMYLRVPQTVGLLQYLQWVFLPDPSVRKKLTLPPKVQVDYRAACFCHRQLIDIGYVCSVCLSIFCTFSPICSTCQTTFKFLSPPKPVKKKSKKTSS